MTYNKRDFSLDTLKNVDAPFIAFLSAFAIGAALVALSKGFSWHLSVVVTIPILVMVSYWAISMFIPRLEVRNDQLGDNMYYLGFLLTLVSLTVTLIQYSSNSDNNYIISNFGVALVATLIGILFRTLHAQMRRDVVGVEKEVQEQLSQASYRLRGQIGAVSEDFSVLTRQITQITEQYSADLVDSHKALSGGLVKVVDDQTDALRSSSENNAKRIERSVTQSISDLESAAADGSRELLDSANSVKLSIEEIASSFGEYLQSHTESLRSVQNQELTQRKSQTNELKSVIAELTSSVSKVNAQAITAVQLERFTDAFETGVLEISELVQNVSKSSESTEESIKKISSKLLSALDRSETKINELIDSVDSRPKLVLDNEDEPYAKTEDLTEGVENTSEMVLEAEAEVEMKDARDGHESPLDSSEPVQDEEFETASSAGGLEPVNHDSDKWKPHTLPSFNKPD